MLGRKGFTLIELLIVVTILSILAGAAVPYVQDYVDEARRGRAKADLDEIRNALSRFEIDRSAPYTSTTIASLGGAYLAKAVLDPWDGLYAVNPASSTVYSEGADGNPGGGDDIVVEFRPKLAVSRVYWVDSNQDQVVSLGDSLNLKLSRPGSYTLAATNFTFFPAGPACGAGVYVPPTLASYPRIASYAITTVSTLAPRTTQIIMAAGANAIRDGGNNPVLLDTLPVLAP